MGRLLDKVNPNLQQQEDDEDTPYFPSEEEYEGYEKQQRPVPYPSIPPNMYKQQTEHHSPLSILEEIKKDSTPKGECETIISGVPVDIHALEDYVVRISPYALKTILRYHHARDIEEMKGYSKRSSFKIDGKTIILIAAAIGMAVLGLIVMMFMPQIMEMFQGGF